MFDLRRCIKEVWEPSHPSKKLNSKDSANFERHSPESSEEPSCYRHYPRVPARWEEQCFWTPFVSKATGDWDRGCYCKRSNNAQPLELCLTQIVNEIWERSKSSRIPEDISDSRHEACPCICLRLLVTWAVLYDERSKTNLKWLDRDIENVDPEDCESNHDVCDNLLLNLQVTSMHNPFDAAFSPGKHPD